MAWRKIYELPNLCRISEGTCNYCSSHYTVSKDFYRAKRAANGQYVTGYLVKSKKDNKKDIDIIVYQSYQKGNICTMASQLPIT